MEKNQIHRRYEWERAEEIRGRRAVRGSKGKRTAMAMSYKGKEGATDGREK